jgi:hypothetical protein
MKKNKKQFTSKDALTQSKIINDWIKETQAAYNKEDVSDSDIIAYLAQVKLGFHQQSEPKN